MTTPTGASRAVELQAAIEAERAELPFLVVRDGADSQRIYILEHDDERLWIGRGSGCDIVVDWDERASRTHAELVRSGHDWAIDDDGLSRNGTFVDDERLHGRRRLVDHDMIRVGDTPLEYRRPTPGTQPVTVAGTDLPGVAKLTDAQRRVLVALCRPRLTDDPRPTAATNQEIADELVLSIDAVKTHMRALFERFGLGDLPQNAKRLELAERAVRMGTVTRRDIATDVRRDT